MKHPSCAWIVAAACVLAVPQAEARLGGGGHALGGGGFHPPQGGGGGHVRAQAGQHPQAAQRFQEGHPQRRQHPPQAGQRPRPAPQPRQAGGYDTRAPHQHVHQRNEIQGGRQVTVNAGNTVVAGRGGGRAPVPYPVYVGGNSGWDAGAVIAGGLVAGATAGLVAGAINNAERPSTVIVESPVASINSADQAQQSANSARNAASDAQRAAAQAQDAATAATSQVPSPPIPSGARYALGTRFAQVPEGCAPETIGPISFDHCGNDWLQPVMEGGTVAWIAVPPPRG